MNKIDYPDLKPSGIPLATHSNLQKLVDETCFLMCVKHHCYGLSLNGVQLDTAQINTNSKRGKAIKLHLKSICIKYGLPASAVQFLPLVTLPKIEVELPE